MSIVAMSGRWKGKYMESIRLLDHSRSPGHCDQWSIDSTLAQWPFVLSRKWQEASTTVISKEVDASVRKGTTVMWTQLHSSNHHTTQKARREEEQKSTKQEAVRW